MIFLFVIVVISLNMFVDTLIRISLSLAEPFPHLILSSMFSENHFQCFVRLSDCLVWFEFIMFVHSCTTSNKIRSQNDHNFLLNIDFYLSSVNEICSLSNTVLLFIGSFTVHSSTHRIRSISLMNQSLETFVWCCLIKWVFLFAMSSLCCWEIYWRFVFDIVFHKKQNLPFGQCVCWFWRCVLWFLTLRKVESF